MQTDKLLSIYTRYNSEISTLLRFADRKMKDSAEIFVIKEKVKLAKEADPGALITRCQDEIWTLRSKIISKDDAVFTIDRDPTAPAAVLWQVARGVYHACTPDERELLWGCIRRMLELVIEYKVLQCRD